MIRKRSYLEPVFLCGTKSIVARLEKMARKGWLLHEIDGAWVYKKTEPRQLRFTVYYLADGADVYPRSEKQNMFFDFCAHTGWERACSSGQMQIFYTDREDAVPLETEPVTAVDAIHAAEKRGNLRYNIWMLAFWVMYFVSNIIWDLPKERNDPRLFLSIGFLVSFLGIGIEIAIYYCWYFKARKRAKEGVFLEQPDISVLRCVSTAVILLCLIGACAAMWVSGDMISLLAIATVLIVMGIVFAFAL